VVEEIRSEGYGYVASAVGFLGCLRAGLHHPDEESTLRAELLRKQGQGVQPPGEVEVAGQEDDRLAHVRQVARAQRERVEPGGEAAAPLLAPEVGRERLDGAIVDAELPVRVAAGGEQQERAPARLVQLVVGEADAVARDVGEDGVGVAELAALETREEVFERVHSCMIA
jgi:hypothetical protein